MQATKSKRYTVVLTGTSPLIMHKADEVWADFVRKWQKDPKNRDMSVKGDDRSPAFTWLGKMYHDGKHVGVDADNLMTMFRDGGKRCPAPKGKGTLKAATQSGITVDQLCWPITVNGKMIPVEPLMALKDETDFDKQTANAAQYGIELFPKRAAQTPTSRVLRVRPRFHNWSISGTITVVDPQLTQEVLQAILDHAGFFCGLCDWRPGAPKAPGQFGRFSAQLTEIK